MHAADRHSRNQQLTVNEMQTFLGKHPFVRWLVRDRARILKYDTDRSGAFSLSELKRAAADWLARHRAVDQINRGTLHGTDDTPEALEQADHSLGQTNSSVEQRGSREGGADAEQDRDQHEDSHQPKPKERSGSPLRSGKRPAPPSTSSEEVSDQGIPKWPGDRADSSSLMASVRGIAAESPEEVHVKGRQLSERTKELESQLIAARTQWKTQWSLVVADRAVLCEELNTYMHDAEAVHQCYQPSLLTNAACRHNRSLQGSTRICG